jgi:hypothetical protein
MRSRSRCKTDRQRRADQGGPNECNGKNVNRDELTANPMGMGELVPGGLSIP